MHYRRFLLCERIAAFDAKIDFKMDLFNALQFLRRSWADVKPETLANCFRKAGFVKEVTAVEQTIAEQIEAEVQAMGERQIAVLTGEQPVEVGAMDELNTVWAGLEAMKLVEGDLGDYLAVDYQLLIGGTRSLAEIAANVSTTDVEGPEAGSDTEEMEIEEVPESKVTSREAIARFKLFKRFVEENSNDPTVLRMSDKLDDYLARERLKKMNQTNILNYFVVNH